MAAHKYPNDVVAQATDMLLACKQIDPTLAVGDITPARLSTELTQAQQVQTEIATLEKQLVELRLQRDMHLEQTWSMTKRLRAAIKGRYGDDSPEYKLVGGTRMSERKHAEHKPQA